MAELIPEKRILPTFVWTKLLFYLLKRLPSIVLSQLLWGDGNWIAFS